ncbi:MAG: hypothetical protein ACK5MU_00625 [Candidatus Saccharimonadales bacterium]
MMGWLKKNRFAIVVTVLYFVVSIILILNHEPWTDEANPYLVAKHMNFSNFFEIISGEPHPILWTLILMPLAKLGVPLIASHIISLVVMALAVWLLMKYAPFPKFAKVAIVLSAALFYFNPVITRDYCLVPLAAILVCIAYKRRFEYPIRYSLAIAFLLQTHFLATGLAAILYLVFFGECIARRVNSWRVGASMLIVGSSVALCVLCAVGSLMGQVIIQETMQCCGGEAAGPSLLDYFSSIDASVFGMAVPIIEVSLALILFYLLLRQRRQFAYLLVAVLANMFVLTFVYGAHGNSQKDAINLVFILVAFWTIYYDKPKDIFKPLQKKIKSMATMQILRKRVPISLVIFVFPFVMSIPNTMMASAYDLTQDFSGSLVLADYINENLPAGSVIVVPSYSVLSSLTAVATELTDGRILWDALNEEPLSYIDYTLPTHMDIIYVPTDKIKSVVEENFDSTELVYYFGFDGAPEGWEELQAFPYVSGKYFNAGITNSILYKVK